MKILQWEKENLVFCTCLFVVLAAMTHFSGQVNSVDEDSSRTLSDGDSDSDNDMTNLSVFNQTFSEWEFRWVCFEFILLLSDDTCPKTVRSLILTFLSLVVKSGAAIVSQNSWMLKGRNMHHVGF